MIRYIYYIHYIRYLKLYSSRLITLKVLKYFKIIYFMHNKKNIYQNKPTQENPRYIRILYLKQVAKPKIVEDQNQILNDKKSLAYLSSLIQDEKKGKIKDLYQNDQISNQIKIGTQNIVLNSDTRYQSVSFYKQANYKKQKQNSLSNILNLDIDEPSQTNIRLNRKSKYLTKVKNQIQQHQKDQLVTSFNNFCKILTPQMNDAFSKYTTPKIMQRANNQGGGGQQKKIMSVQLKKQEIDSISLSQQKFREVKKLDDRSKKYDKLEQINQRKNIIYKKNFKYIENFNWKKISDSDFII